MLVLDANTAISLGASEAGFSVLGGESLQAPPLLWSEARATLHLKTWRREIRRDAALEVLRRLESGAISKNDHPDLGMTAWRLADQTGWGKTYDAEYVALAVLLNCRLVSHDARLHRGAARLGLVVSLNDL